jgi:hypothetical protein
MLAPPPKENYIESLRSRIVEGRTLTPDQFRPVTISLQVTLGSISPRGQAQFTIPSNQRMLLMQMTPIIVPATLSNPLDATSGVYNVGVPAPGDVFAGGTVRDLLYGKAQNCRVSLGLVSQTFQLFPQYSFSLADLMSENGECPSLMDMPGILPQGTTIDLLAALQDSAAAGGDTEYGLVLSGAYIAV